MTPNALTRVAASLDRECEPVEPPAQLRDDRRFGVAQPKRPITIGRSFDEQLHGREVERALRVEGLRCFRRASRPMSRRTRSFREL